MNWDPVETIADATGSLIGRYFLFLGGSVLTLLLVGLLALCFEGEFLRLWQDNLSEIIGVVFFGILLFPLAVIIMAMGWGYAVPIGLLLAAIWLWHFIKALRSEEFLPEFFRPQSLLVLLFLGTAYRQDSAILACIMTLFLTCYLDLRIRKKLGLPRF